MYTKTLKICLILLGLIIISPTFFGILGVIFPAFGYFPTLGGNSFSFKFFIELFSIPGIMQSSLLSFSSGVFSTIFALLFSQIILIYIYDTKIFYYLKILISPLLALPHLTMAVGLLFLMSSSGLIVRILSPWLTGFDRPPEFYLIPDQYGLSLILGLTLKEIPFFLLTSIAALEQFPSRKIFKVGRSLQHSTFSTWWLLLFPIIYQRIKLVIFIVIAFSSSVIDMALILAPTTPSTLSIRILQVYQSFEFDAIFAASSLALVQMLIILIIMLIWNKVEIVFKTQFMFLFIIKFLPRKNFIIGKYLYFLAVSLILLSIIGLLNSIFWAIGQDWYFPDILPNKYSLIQLINFLKTNEIMILTTLYIAFLVSFSSVFIIILWIELCDYLNIKKPYFEGLIFLPLFIPQISFLIGLQSFLIKIGLQSYLISLVWVEILYVLPYCFILLGPAFRDINKQYLYLASSLGKSRLQRLFLIKIPLISSSILTSFAIGIIISLSLYTPVYFIGAGRITTLTVETLNLALSGSRQDLGVATVFQIILPILILLIITYTNKKFNKWSF